MKKTFLMMAVLLMMGSAAFAGGGFDIAIGPKFGYQTTKLSYDRADIKDGFSNHWCAGIFGRVTIGRLYVQPEIMYFKTSNVFDVDVTGQGSDNLLNIPTGAHVNLTLNQANLQVPVMIGLNIIDLNIISLRAHVGPTANFVLKSTTLFDKTYALNNQQVDMNQEQLDAANKQNFDTKTITWGAQVGVGVDVLKRITLDINYNFGLSKVYDQLSNTTLGEYFDFGNTDYSKQNTFMVTVGFKFF